jgi:SM-20-related protein
MTQILDFDKLSNTPINSEYFPYCQVDCFINQDVLWDVLHDFPKIDVRGSIPAHRLTYGLYFQKLIDELYQKELRTLISEKFNLDLSCSYPMLTIRGKTSLRDGYIHTDTPSKLVTMLLYFNEDWSQPTGNLRLLRDNSSLDNYFEEITPSAGKLLVFKVTDNCWHGHYPFIGKRKTIQFNYVAHKWVAHKELRRHSYSYTLKKITHLLNLD